MDKSCAKTHAACSSNVFGTYRPNSLLKPDPESAILRKFFLFLFADARQSTSAKKRSERPAFVSVHVDTY